MLELTDVCMKHYTDKMRVDELTVYLRDVIGMNDQQVKSELLKRFNLIAN